MARRQMRPSSCGTPSGMGGGDEMMLAMMSGSFLPPCGTVPASISKSMAPSRYTSVRSLSMLFSPPSISGAM
jgi:hypothetical protein